MLSLVFSWDAERVGILKPRIYRVLTTTTAGLLYCIHGLRPRNYVASLAPKYVGSHLPPARVADVWRSVCLPVQARPGPRSKVCIASSRAQL